MNSTTSSSILYSILLLILSNPGAESVVSVEIAYFNSSRVNSLIISLPSSSVNFLDVSANILLSTLTWGLTVPSGTDANLHGYKELVYRIYWIFLIALNRLASFQTGIEQFWVQYPDHLFRQYSGRFGVKIRVIFIVIFRVIFCLSIQYSKIK